MANEDGSYNIKVGPIPKYGREGSAVRPVISKRQSVVEASFILRAQLHGQTYQKFSFIDWFCHLRRFLA